jgi:predicted ATP-grasp superfamily ATP-dependent carboligase
MVGGIVGILICIWFYRSAERIKLSNPIQWVIGSVIVYYGVKAIWTYVILKPLMGGSFSGHSMTAGLLIEFSGTLFGAVAAALLHYKVMLKQQPR